MFPYVFLLVSSVIVPLILCQSRRPGISGTNSKLIRKRNQMTVSLFFFELFVLLALRDISVGADLKEYRDIFEICSRTPFSKLSRLNWELGYTIFSKCISLIYHNYRFFLIVCAIITIVPIYKLYSLETRYSVLLIILFINMPCFLLMFSGLRQAISISIGVIAYMKIEDGKKITGSVLILLAILFHASAIVLFLLYPLFYFKVKAHHMWYVIPILVAIYIFRVEIFGAVIIYMPSRYVEFYGELEQTGAIGMMLLFLLFSTFAFVILDEDTMSKKDYSLRNILLLATVFQFFVPIHGLIQRASYYFLIFAPVSILHVVQAPKKRLRDISTLAVVVLTCFFTVYFFYNALFSTDNLLGVFPYRFLGE